MRIGRHIMALMVLPLMCTVPETRAQDVVVRRGVVPVVDPVAGVGTDGVTIAVPGPLPPGEALPLLSWDQVASVSGPFADSAQVYSRIADAAWRARTRLERGDLSGAEPLFEELFATYEGRRGPLAQLVTGGLLLCRNARGATTLAVPALLGYLEACEGDLSPRLIVRGDDAADPSDLTPIDASWRLSPAVPPIWLPTLAVQTGSRAAWKAYAGRTGLLGELYRLSQAGELGDVSDKLPPRPDASDESLCLVWEIVVSRAGDETARAGAREQLRGRIGSGTAQPPWLAAWCRAAVGRSLLRERDPESRLLGVAELLSVPAAAGHAVPYLTGVCLAEAAASLHAQGDEKGAMAVRARLSERFAGHPALEWEALRFTTPAASVTLPVRKEDVR